jgi:hypothetical protein
VFAQLDPLHLHFTRRPHHNQCDLAGLPQWRRTKNQSSLSSAVSSSCALPKFPLKQRSRYVLFLFLFCAGARKVPRLISFPSQLAAVIEENSGEPSIFQNSPERKDVIECTHIVSSTINFQSYDYFSNALIPIVKPAWIQTSLSKRKLVNPRHYSPDPRLFLNDVVVTCGDIPEGDKDAIIGGVLAKGGLYSPRLSAMVTHLVDLTADSDKARLVKAKAMRTKIVLPHWSVSTQGYLLTKLY